MTLKELVEKYDGEMQFEVSRAVTGGVEEIVEFCNTDHEAIKDVILDSTVKNYSFTTSSTTRLTTVRVVLDAVVTADSADGTTTDTTAI